MNRRIREKDEHLQTEERTRQGMCLLVHKDTDVSDNVDSFFVHDGLLFVVESRESEKRKEKRKLLCCVV